MVRIFLITVLLLNCRFAFSQKVESPVRKGLMFSFATGVANAQNSFPTKKQSNNDLALNWKIGYMLNPKLAILLNGSVSIYDYNLSDRPRKRDFGGVFPSLQYHLTDKLWLLGGIGIGTDAPVFYDLKPENEVETKYYLGIGGITSFGYEIYKRKNFVIDLQARFNYSSVNLPIGKLNGFNSGILIGINFY